MTPPRDVGEVKLGSWEVAVQPVPRGVIFGVGLSLLLVVAAAIASRRPPAPAHPADVYGSEWADSCFRYGRFECCVHAE